VKRAIDIGFGEIEGGPISYCIPYSRNTDLVEVIKNWKKVEIYCSGANLNMDSQIVRENFGVLSACLIPPIQTLLVDTLEALFVANFNGGKIMCSVGATGCDYQDIALVEAIREVVPWALELFNLKMQNPFISYHHWMGPFPHGKTESLEIITRGTYLSFLTNSEKVVTKTIDEAHGIPSNASNSESVKLVKETLNHLLQKKSKISQVENYLVEEEREVLIKEVKNIITILKNEHDTIEEIILQSILKGFVDVPFSPHLENRNSLKSLRADDNSIRVTSDFYGNHSKNFVNREIMFLKNYHSWNRLSSDTIVNHILWPSQNKIRDLTDANYL
jgi:methylaspartate mutase epsilon subunit